MNPETVANNMDDTTSNNEDNCENNDIIIMDNQKHSQTWGTWEELLLVCAVKRHGFRNWDSVAMEVHAKSSLPRLITTAHNCKQKYRDLKRRFTERRKNGEEVEEEEEDTEKNRAGSGEDKVDSISWLEQLRKLRLVELRRELQRHDVSILSLQLKVKKLEEERDRSLRDQKPDLGIDSKEQRSETERTEREGPDRSKAVPGEESDRENWSVNESNSTGSGGKTGDSGPQPGQAREESVDPDPPVRKTAEEGSFSRGSEVSHSDDLVESTTQASGDVQSSASLRRKRRRTGWRSLSRKESLGGNDGGNGISAAARKSQPLIGFLDMIRAHQHGSLFERRLRSQVSKDYKNLVRQHVDLETMQTKLDQGFYSSSTISFYRDLLLLFINTIVFFPKSSTESAAALELRTLVSKQMIKQTLKSDPNSQEPATPILSLPNSNDQLKASPEIEGLDSFLTREKSSAPLVVCRKRSSVSTKPSSSSSFSQKDDKKAEETSEKKEKPLTGTRGSRRNSKGASAIANNSNNSSTPNNRKQMGSITASSNDNTQETAKTDNKKPSASDKKKSVADFLKRIKKSSPVVTAKKGGRGGDRDPSKNSGNEKKDNKVKERVLRSNNVKKKKVKEESSPSKRSVGRSARKGVEPVVSSGIRGRETGDGGGGQKKRQKKRARR